MVWFIISQMFSTFLDWFRIGRMSEQEKDLEILLLRQQLIMLERPLNKPVRPSRIEKLTLAVITTRFKAAAGQSSTQLRAVIRLFQPETVLTWQREFVHRKWTNERSQPSGRPRTSNEIDALILRFVGENRDWGYGKHATVSPYGQKT